MAEYEIPETDIWCLDVSRVIKMPAILHMSFHRTMKMKTFIDSEDIRLSHAKKECFFLFCFHCGDGTDIWMHKIGFNICARSSTNHAGYICDYGSNRYDRRDPVKYKLVEI